MSWKVGLVAAVVLMGVGAAAAAAGDRPLFDFKGEVPVPGGTLRLEAWCTEGADGLSCRAGGRGPSGRGFQFEGHVGPSRPEPPRLEQTGPTQNAPRWF